MPQSAQLSNDTMRREDIPVVRNMLCSRLWTASASIETIDSDDISGIEGCLAHESAVASAQEPHRVHFHGAHVERRCRAMPPTLSASAHDPCSRRSSYGLRYRSGRCRSAARRAHGAGAPYVCGGV